MREMRQTAVSRPQERLRLPVDMPEYTIDREFLEALPQIDEYLDALFKKPDSLDHGNAQALDSFIQSVREKALAGIEEQYVSNVEELEMRRIKRRADLTGALRILEQYKTRREEILAEIVEKRAVFCPKR